VSDSGKVYLKRFSRSERAVHWIHAAAFFVLLGSGLVLYLPSLGAVGDRPLVKDSHLGLRMTSMTSTPKTGFG
jgi:cytochrome b subunit of formate dehydrogenase